MTMKHVIFFILLFSSGLLLAQESVKIIGVAAHNPGAMVKAERFEDYFTKTMVELANTSLQSDSTFELKFEIDEIEKIKISVNDDFCYMYVQPGGNYKIVISDNQSRNFNNPLGNELDASFLDLSKDDINYKILAFDMWYDQFMGDNYHLRTRRDSTFAKNLIQFENRVADYYKADSNGFLRTHVKYRIASIEELNFIGARNERARYTVNLAPFTVQYRSEEYMNYIRNFYKNYFESLPNEINNTVFKAIVAGSPTRMVNALAKDYRVANVRVRELVMIISLADVYHDKNYPQSRINTILDSIANNGLFQENKVIAKNTLAKLRRLNPGSLAPKYVFLDAEGKEIYPKTFLPKYTYIQFIHTDQSNCLLQLEMLKELHSKYNSSVAFVTVVMNDADWSNIQTKLKTESIPWPMVIPKDAKEINQQFQLSVYPHYVLIDAQGYIVQSPAASPIPDGTYKTIDYYLYEIHKVISRQKK